MFVHQATLRPACEGFKECGRQGVIGNIQARYYSHWAAFCHALVDWEERGAVGVAGVPCRSGRNSDNSTSFLGDVMKGGEAGGCCFEACEGTPVYEEVFRCAGADGYHQGYL